MKQKNNILYLLAIIALCMHIAVQVAPVWMPKGEEGVSIQICAAQGLETITVDQNGQPLPPAQSDIPTQNCVFCLASAQSVDHPESPAFKTTLVLRDSELLQEKSTPADLSHHKNAAHLTRGPPLHT